jgi:hypothetical protein
MLIFDKIEHYRKIITVLSFTADLPRQIEGVDKALDTAVY